LPFSAAARGSATSGCAADACICRSGTAVSRIRCRRRSRLLPLLTEQPHHLAKPPYANAVGGAAALSFFCRCFFSSGAAAASRAVVLFRCLRRSRRRRRSRFLLQLLSKQLLFLERAQLFIGRYGQPLEPVYRLKNGLHTFFHFWCSIVLLCAASL
ncbi:hypothetical protein M885DRAFT_519260, partial [Pelagophyceae sp. CCMP2097]